MYKRQFSSNKWFPMAHYMFQWKAYFLCNDSPQLVHYDAKKIKKKLKSNNAKCMLSEGWKSDPRHHPKLQHTLGFVLLSFEKGKTTISRCQGRVHWQCCIQDPHHGRWIYKVRLSCGWTMQPWGWRLWNGLAQHFYKPQPRALHVFATSPYEIKGDKTCHIKSPFKTNLSCTL